MKLIRTWLFALAASVVALGAPHVAQTADSLLRMEGSPAFLDANGDPRIGAKLCYFRAGTTTELTVYKDASLATEWDQPITLNASGSLDDPVYVGSTYDVKEVLYDTDDTDCTDGTVIFTSDNIPAALEIPSATYAAPRQAAIAKAADYTVTAADLGSVINVNATGGPVTITLPAATSAVNGDQVVIRKVDSSSNAVTVVVTGAATIDGSSSLSLPNQYDRLAINTNGATWYTLSGLVDNSITFAKLNSAAFSTDGTFSANSDTLIPTQKAAKAYADTLFASGIAWVDPVAAATTANVTLSTDVENGDTLDGVVLATNDRILVKDQSTAAENGIYVVAASGAPTRSTDIDAAGEFAGTTVYIDGGTANQGDTYTQTATVAVVDTDDVSWSLIASGVTYTADDVTLQKTGTTFAIKDGGVDAAAMADNAIGTDEIINNGVENGDLATDVQQALVPTGTILAYAGTSAPAGYLLAYGQCVDDTTYAALDAVLGSTWDTANGCIAGEVGIPDLRGRVVAGQDDMGGVSADRLLGTDTDTVGVNGDTFGAAGGEELTNDVVAHTHTGSVANYLSGATASASHYHFYYAAGANNPAAAGSGSANSGPRTYTTTTSDAHAHSAGTLYFSGSFTTASTGDASVTNVQPTIILNYIIKI